MSNTRWPGTLPWTTPLINSVDQTSYEFLCTVWCSCFFAMCIFPVWITGSVVALHCCKAHAKTIRKWEIWPPPYKIVTSKNIIFKLCIRDYVGEITRRADFGFNQYSGGFSQNRRNITNITTLWLFWLFCPVLTFFLDPAPRSNR